MLPSSAQAYGELQNYNKNRKTAQQIMDESNAKYDIGGLNTRLSNLRGLVGNLENSVQQVDPSVTGRTSGSLVTEAQRSALVNRERAPILSDLAKQQQGLGQAQQDWGMANQLAGEYSRGLTGEQEGQYNRLMQGYQASLAAEQAAEEKRRWEAQQAENIRQFNEQQRSARAAAAGAGGYDLQGMIDALNRQNGGNTYNPSEPYANSGGGGGGGGFHISPTMARTAALTAISPFTIPYTSAYNAYQNRHQIARNVGNAAGSVRRFFGF